MAFKGKERVAFIDYEICKPTQCNSGNGICPAVSSCSHHVLKQIDGAYSAPIIDPNLCQGCHYCVKACHLGAIKIIKNLDKNLA